MKKLVEEVQVLNPNLWVMVLHPLIKEYHLLCNQTPEIEIYDEIGRTKQEFVLSINKSLRTGEINSICQFIETSSKVVIKETDKCKKTVFKKGISQCY